jgi:peptide-methionine (S)-S-oxide reductase
VKTADINDVEFRSAVEAIDAGNIAALSILINENPDLLTKRLNTPDAQGYFKDPYLLWFVADNPIRNATLAPNIAKITQFIIETLKQFAEESLQYQLDYALELVITGKTPRDFNVQIELIDVLMNAGAKPGNALAALANGNKDAAMHLLDRGAELTLPVAVGLRDFDEINRFFPLASASEKTTALTVATFYGMDDLVSLLLEKGVNVNGELEKSGFHTRGTPLHQAVS